MESICPQCNKTITEGKKFCAYCGYAMTNEITEKKRQLNVNQTLFTFGFMVIPSIILALILYFIRLNLIPHLRGEVTLWSLSFLGIVVLSTIWITLIKKLRKISELNWKVLILITIPFSLLNARNIFILLIPLYGVSPFTIITLLISLISMFVLSLYINKFFSHKSV